MKMGNRISMGNEDCRYCKNVQYSLPAISSGWSGGYRVHVPVACLLWLSFGLNNRCQALAPMAVTSLHIAIDRPLEQNLPSVYCHCNQHKHCAL